MENNKYYILSECQEPIFPKGFISVNVYDNFRVDKYRLLAASSGYVVSGIFEYNKEYFGTICEVVRMKEKSPSNVISLKSLERVKIVEFEKNNDYFDLDSAIVQTISADYFVNGESQEFQSLLETINEEIDDIKEYAKEIPAFSDVVNIKELFFDEWVIKYGRLFSSNDAKILFAEKDDVLRAKTIKDALCLKMQCADLEDEIEEKVNKNIDQDQKNYYLHEKLRVINKELYNTESDTETYRAKIDAINASDDVKSKLYEELSKVVGMQSGTPEAYVARNYIDTVCSLPWGVYSEENLSLQEANKILEEDHYGIKDVKERIMEFLAIHKLVKNKKGNILCFYGPPGTGKTSVVRSIARALNRKYVRLSLGGVHDEAEIRGHRRTYIGALAGKIITGIRDAGTMNPVFLMDEVDKLSNDIKGDPASALLEVLDPEQNKGFKDNYIDMPFDLSQVLFITTANNISTIAKPLLDRMELIEMSSYTLEEKREIALRHLIPKQLSEHAVPENTVTFLPETVDAIIEDYTEEAGVRKLEQLIARIIRKIAVKYGDKGFEPITVTPDLIEYLGAPRHRDKKIRKEEVGVITGLAYTEYGGVTMDIECVLTAGKSNLILTGNLGEVMKESAKEALTFVKSQAEKYSIPIEAFEKDVHINATEGGIPKDGPSAGVALATLILSAFTGKKIRSDVALTGEITITGKVLPIGGVKEKSLGALRRGITKVIMPLANKVDVDELPPMVKDKIEYTFVERAEQVFEVMLIENN